MREFYIIAAIALSFLLFGMLVLILDVFKEDKKMKIIGIVLSVIITIAVVIVAFKIVEIGEMYG